MRRSITRAAMACIAVFLSPSTQGQPLDNSMRGYRPLIRASNDNVLGTVVAGRDDGLQVLVVSLVGDDLDAVPLLLDGSLARGIAQTVNFESPDCVGEPLFEPRGVQGAPLSVFLASVVLGIRPGMPAYLERQEEPVLRTVRSGYTQGGTCSNSNPIQLPLVTMKPVALSLSDFPPPYQLLRAEPQDVDVPGNLTMHDSTGSTIGNVLKEGVPFLHNFGTNNTFLGSGAGNFTMTGVENTATGYGVLSRNGSGYQNTATGFTALSSNTGGVKNTATGAGALLNNTDGSFNTAIGFAALYSNTTGSGNTATGQNALYSNTTGYSNTASGWYALQNNTEGAANTANGVGVLASNTTGSRNTASGDTALNHNITGSDNTANGYFALSSNFNGYGNTATGTQALSINTTGSSNTASGSFALYGNRTGNNNTAIGASADVSVDNLSNATAIGFGAIVDGSNKIRLGNHDVTVIEGEVPYTYTSDRDTKENFQAVDAEAVLSKIRAISVRSWNYKGQDAKQFRHYGPVAQDFFAAFGHDSVGTIGTPTTITSGDLDGILMIAVQALEKRTVEQWKEMDALRVENADLKARLEALERLVGSRAHAHAL